MIRIIRLNHPTYVGSRLFFIFYLFIYFSPSCNTYARLRLFTNQSFSHCKHTFYCCRCSSKQILSFLGKVTINSLYRTVFINMLTEDLRYALFLSFFLSLFLSCSFFNTFSTLLYSKIFQVPTCYKNNTKKWNMNRINCWIDALKIKKKTFICTDHSFGVVKKTSKTFALKKWVGVVLGMKQDYIE